MKERLPVSIEISNVRIKLIGEAYERKIDMARSFQLGQDLKKVKFKIEPLFKIEENEKEDEELDLF